MCILWQFELPACTLRLFLHNGFPDSTFLKELSVVRVISNINREFISPLSLRYNLQWLQEDLYLCKWNQNCIIASQRHKFSFWLFVSPTVIVLEASYQQSCPNCHLFFLHSPPLPFSPLFFFFFFFFVTLKFFTLKWNWNTWDKSISVSFSVNSTEEPDKGLLHLLFSQWWRCIY